MLLSCDKQELMDKKAINIAINGYNGSSNLWYVNVDEIKFDKNVANGNYLLKPKTNINFSVVFPYESKNPPKKLSIREVDTDRLIFEAEINNNNISTSFNYIQIDGKQMSIPQQSAKPNFNKIGFFLHNVKTKDPFDIYMVFVNPTSKEESWKILAEKVYAEQWVHIDYLPENDFISFYKLQNSSFKFLKHGSKTEWAFLESQMMSQIQVPAYTFPIEGENGFVLNYFFTLDNYQIQQSSLFDVEARKK